MIETIDRLIFALDGDVTDLNSRFGEVEAGAQKTGAAVQSSMSSAFKKVADEAAVQTAKVRRSLEEIDGTGRRTGAVWETTAQSIARSTGLMHAPRSAEQSWQTFGKALGDIKTPAHALRDAMEEAGGGAEHLGNNVNISRRELVYMVRELISGDWQRLPATFALLSTHMLELSGAAIAAGAGILAIPAALVIVAEKADASLAKLRTSLALTAYASGLSVTQASVAASQISSQVPMGMFAARNFVAGMAGNMVPGSAMVEAGVASGRYSKATGASTEETQKIIKEMFAEPSKSAAELNASMNLLTNSQTRQVEELEKSGEYQKAGQVILDAFSSRAKEAADQAGFMATALSNASVNLSGFGGWIAHLVGAGIDDQTKLDDLKRRRAAVAYQAEHGGAPQDERLALMDKRIAEMQRGIDVQADLAKDLGHRADNNRAVTDAMKDVDAQSGSYAAHLRGLDQEIARDTKAVQADAEQRHKSIPELEAAIARARQLEAVTLASKHQKTPAELAAQDARDAKYLAGLPSDQVAVASARLQAQRTYEKNLANPATALDAEAIKKSDMAKAAIADSSKIRAQNEEIANLQLHAKNQMALVAAYEDGKDAVLAMTAQLDAEEAAHKHSIRTSQEHVKALADLRTAFATSAKAAAEHLDTQGDVIKGLRVEVEAGGDPAAVRAANIETEALKLNSAERDNALALKKLDNAEGEKALRIADEHLRQQRATLTLEDTLKSEAPTNAAIFAKRQTMGNIQGQMRALSQGADPDDLRHVEVQQQVYEEVARLNPLLDRNSSEFQKLYKDMLSVSEATSDLTDKMNKMKQEASELSAGLIGPLKNFLHNRGGNPLDMLAEMGQNTLDTLVQHEILDPMQKGLDGIFSNMLGVPGITADGTMASPYYVVPMPGMGGGLFGGNGGGTGGDFLNGGGGGDLLSSLFGGGGGATGLAGAGDAARMAAAGTPMGGGGFLDFLTTFAGLFDDGGTIGPGQWGIKSGMPEIIQGGTHGVSILPLTAPVVKAAAGAQGRGPGTNSNPGGPGNGGPGSMRQGDTHFWNITTPNVDSFIKSRSQVEARFTMAAARGQRNS